MIPNRTPMLGALALVGLSWARWGAAETAPSVTASFNAPVSTADPVVLTLSHPLTPAHGRLAVFVGTTDWSDLFAVRGTTAILTPGALSLPVGATEVTAYLVTPRGEWRELGRFPLALTAPPAVSRALKRTLDLAFKAQLGEGHRPDSNAPPRATFQDLSFQAALEAAASGNGYSRKASFKLVGTTHRAEALRFGAIGAEAPRVDLAGYAVGLGQGRARLSLGGLSSGSHRHLMNGFQGRGATVTLPLGRPAELAVAAVSGSQIVGWDNPLGLDQSAHRIVVGTLGLELEPSRPGALRAEASFLDGSVLPLPNYNQGVVRDAAKSRGFGLRLAGNGGSGRLRLEASLARSRFEIAPDPALESGLPIAPETPAQADARYARAEVDALALGAGGRLPFTFTVTGQHERLDPLYRSVGVQAQADLQQNALGAGLRLGEGSMLFVHLAGRDNLGRVPSILTTLTRQDNLEVSLPLGTLLTAQGQPALPLLSYSLARVRQSGAGLPPDSDFAPGHVPDQVSVSHAAGAQWQFATTSLAYNLTASRQDNRQPGREAADFAQQTHQLSFGFVREERLDASLEVQVERSENLELRQSDRLRRIGVNLKPRLPNGLGATAVLSASWSDATGAERTGSNLEADLQAYWRSGLRTGRKAPSASVFVRWATRRAQARDPLLQVSDDRAAWQVSAGINLSAF